VLKESSPVPKSSPTRKVYSRLTPARCQGYATPYSHGTAPLWGQERAVDPAPITSAIHLKADIFSRRNIGRCGSFAAGPFRANADQCPVCPESDGQPPQGNPPLRAKCFTSHRRKTASLCALPQAVEPCAQSAFRRRSKSGLMPLSRRQVLHVYLPVAGQPTCVCLTSWRTCKRRKILPCGPSPARAGSVR